jgi:hypothetical protein
MARVRVREVALAEAGEGVQVAQRLLGRRRGPEALEEGGVVVLRSRRGGDADDGAGDVGVDAPGSAT